MLSTLGRLLKFGLLLGSLRSLSSAAELQRAARTRVRATQCAAWALLSGILALLAGFGALLLWISPALRPLLLAGVAAALALAGFALHNRARTLRREATIILGASTRNIRHDLSVVGEVFHRKRSAPANCAQCGGRMQTSDRTRTCKCPAPED